MAARVTWLGWPSLTYLGGTLASQAALGVRLAGNWRRAVGRPGYPVAEGLALVPFYGGLVAVAAAVAGGSPPLALVSWLALSFALTPAVAAAIVSRRAGLTFDQAAARLRGRNGS